MPIRRLFLLMIAVLSVLALAAGMRVFSETRARLNAIDWLQHGNEVSGMAQAASGALARERGMTALLLSQPSTPSDEQRQAILSVRAEADRSLQHLAALTDKSARLAPRHALIDTLHEVRAQHDELRALRKAADTTFSAPQDASALQPQRWIDQASWPIDFLHHLIGISFTPVGQDSPSTTVQPLVKDTLFTLSELLGRERALIASALARQQGFSPQQLRELDHYRSNILHKWKRADGLLQHFQHEPAVAEAIEHFWTSLFVHYEDMRRVLIDAGERGQAFPVTAEEWFAEATRGIDGALALSEAIRSEIDLRAQRLRADAYTDCLVAIALLLAVLAGFLLSALLIQRRVLRPLHKLEFAANAISNGDFTPCLTPSGRDEFGRLARVFEHMRESLVATKREHEATLQEMHKFNVAIENSVSSVIITDERGIIEYTNPQFSQTTGYRPEEVRGLHVSILKSGYTPSEHYQGLWATLRTGHAWKGELLNRRKEGELYWETVTISPVRDDESGRIIHYISIQHDISDRKRVEARLDFVSSYDALTRLPNRALLNLRFGDARSSARQEGSHIALLVLGIQHFKRINDSLGHGIGDHFLCEIATRLTHSIREQDIASRLSGSEFAVLLTGLENTNSVPASVHSLLESLRKPLYIDGHALQPQLHAGIAVFPEDGETLDQLLTGASMALHQAERQGGELLMFYTEALNTEAQARLSLESALRLALANRQLELHFQPRVDLASGQIVAAEALARWRHPETGNYIPPDHFIPISEDSGLIHALGEWALHEACRQNHAWQEAGLPRIPVAVNLSALQLQQRSLPEQIRSVLQRTGLAAEYLEIELTESAVMDSPEEAAVALHLLKALGLNIAIDDFGTGYSSLAYLNRFPVDLLKIDRSFINRLESDPAAVTIASSVIALAHRMGLRVVAEGVESQAQLELLRKQACDEIQGYYFSQPLPPAAFAELLHSGRSLQQPTAAQPQTTYHAK